MANYGNVENKNVLAMSADEARDFFLKPSSYCNMDLPEYFSFGILLNTVFQYLRNKKFSDVTDFKKLNDIDDANHKLITNKDGKFAWRPLEICNPVLYVNLVMTITEESHWGYIQRMFKKFQRNPQIQCVSIPVKSTTKKNSKAAQIRHWWDSIEQRSISLALDFNFVIHTDITDCYGALYTHSIAWALHGIKKAKKNQTNEFLGNIIDRSIRNMRYGQTNGIPQGSTLMDFIAEIVLGYIDKHLSIKLKCLGIEDYHILRYRDDYRIFTNSCVDGETIQKELAVILSVYGFKLNSFKTNNYSDCELIPSAIKKDKLALNQHQEYHRNLQKHLLLIHQHSIDHPNAGSLSKLLINFSKRLKKFPLSYYKIDPFISIIVDIALHNPKQYSRCIMLISILLGFIENKEEKEKFLLKIRKKFSKIPNIGFLEIWLQRLTVHTLPEMQYGESLCQIVAKTKFVHDLWNFDWIKCRGVCGV